MSAVTIAGTVVAGGSRGRVQLPVTHDLAGAVTMTVHVAAGAADGPTLLLLSMLHGNEWFSVLVLRELLARIDPARLRGCVVAVPVANPTAFLTGTRCVQDDSDEPDANRSFGGIYDWTTNQVARTIERELFPLASAVIDYHVGDWGATMADVSFVSDYKNASLSDRSRKMAFAAGFPVMHALSIFSGLRGPRTSLGCAGERFGIPGLVMEIGGLGFGAAQEAAWLEENVQATLGVMHELGMIDGTARHRDRYLLIEDYWRVGPRAGGYLEPVIGLDRQFTEIAAGELMARVIDPATLDVVDELRCPGRGVLFYTCRAYVVRPGGWAFGVANLQEGKCRWVSAS